MSESGSKESLYFFRPSIKGALGDFMFAVQAEKLRKDFLVSSGLFRKSRLVRAVCDIDLNIKEGEAVAFIGPNGAGKSTTIKMLTGILKPSSGKARVLGLDPFRDRAKLVRQIGAVFGQRSQLWLHLPARASFDLLGEIYDLNKAEFKKQRDMLVDCFDLYAFFDTPVRKLSLGERMRAEIAASLLHKPRLLLLDEPTIGVDVVARMRLRELISKWHKEEGMTIFLTSHDTGDIESVASRLIMINHGRITVDDTIDGLRAAHGQTDGLESTICMLFG